MRKRQNTNRIDPEVDVFCTIFNYRLSYSKALQHLSILVGAMTAMAIICFNVNTVAAVDVTGYTISPSFRSMQGYEISNVLIGHPVTLNLDIHNNRPDERSDVIIIEVRDAGTGFTHYLGWQTFAADSDSDYAMTTYWIPSESGEYVLRAFVMDGLALGERAALSIVHKSKLLAVDSDT